MFTLRERLQLGVPVVGLLSTAVVALAWIASYRQPFDQWYGDRELVVKHGYALSWVWLDCLCGNQNDGFADSFAKQPGLPHFSGIGGPFWRVYLPLWMPFVAIAFPTALLWLNCVRPHRPGRCPG